MLNYIWADMNSFNHYAYGAIGKWLYEVCEGLKRDESCPGYQHFDIEPCPGGNLRYAETIHRTGYGRIAVRWEKEEKQITLYAEIPANTTASIILPGAEKIVDHGGLDFIEEEDRFMADAGSGKYRIQYQIY